MFCKKRSAFLPKHKRRKMPKDRTTSKITSKKQCRQEYNGLKNLDRKYGGFVSQ